MKLKLHIGLSVCLLSASLTAQTKIPPYKEVTLKNGLRVLLMEDHSTPVDAIAVVYDVGSRVEKPGATGFAHLFEHMMFQGSANVGKGEHMQLIQENGGAMNGTTTEDRTNYFEMLPANQIDLGLYLEADRMRSLAVTQANLDNQRNAVQEEKRLRIDNQAYGRSNEVLQNLMYDNFAYKHSTMGSMADLNAASVQDVQKFFKTYYAPNNAVIALVGDFKSADALKKVEQYFGSIPSQPAPPPLDIAEPKQQAERRQTITDDFAKLPMLLVGYKTTRANTPEFFALDLFMSVLCDGQSSRLYRRLVEQDKIAVQVEGGMEPSRGIAMAEIQVLSPQGTDLKKVEAVIYEEISALAKSGPEDWEMEKVLNSERKHQVGTTSSDLNRAITMAQDAVFYKDPTLMYTEVKRYDVITKDDIRRVAQQYLSENNRSVLITLPKVAPATKETR
ncbi:pitrilysin family protein [Granulicella sp. S156]|uniref:M16 family metallopeptidase n=1 Tax=Granulicella sp. S156 TaxID=1747224 RepID=UPI00131B39A7|nr:pitrilysin family protein [Granulicella sp. S156]